MRPLADRLRPDSLSTVLGQDHLIGPGKPLSGLIEQKKLFSMILWGPPGVGKTTLARILAKETDRKFIEISAVAAGKKEMREVVDEAGNSQKNLLEDYRSPVVFIDEIHRFNKAQQDFLLPAVETGKIILIGATTENPSFEVISPLLSRCRVFTLKMLSSDHLNSLVDQALTTLKKEQLKIKLTKDARGWLINYASGDARALLTLIDHCLGIYGDLDLTHLQDTAEKKHLPYDKDGEEHYNTISAFIKSMRASQPDASLYYLARMIEAGESPTFIARRMVIFASEDIGLAQPTALVVANAVFRAVETVGFPEASINLAHGVTYLSQCPKDRRAYDGLRAAQAEVAKSGNLPIPLKIRNAPTGLMKDLGYGQDYQMYDPGDYLPDEISRKRFLTPKPKTKS